MVLSVELEDNVWRKHPGETINGKVIVDKQIWNKVEGLTIRLYGKLEIGRRSRRNSRATTLPPEVFGNEGFFVSAGERWFEEVVLDSTISLIDNWKVLRPGRHEFLFAFTLPEPAQLPPSFKFSGARIHYELITSLKRPRDDYKLYQTPLQILTSPDVYKEEDIQSFLHHEEATVEKTVSQFLGCCCYGFISLNVRMETKCFRVGTAIHFIVKVRNNLRHSVGPVTAILIRHFKCVKNSFKINEKIVSADGPVISPDEFQVWSGSLQIQSDVIPNSVNHQQLFHIQHKIIVLSPNHRASEVQLEIPVMLLPHCALPNIFSISTGPLEAGPSLPYPSEMDGNGLPPPSYDEATQICHNANDDESSTSHLVLSEPDTN